MTRLISPAAAGMSRLRRALATATEPLTARQLSELVHLSLNALQSSKYLPGLVAAGEIHIAEYIRQPMGRQAAAYVFGPGKNAKPEPFCKLRAAREWKLNSGYNETIRARRLLARAAQKPPLVALLEMRT